jgi:hypothetical protein
MRTYCGPNVCDDCRDPNWVYETYWASGNKHYCEVCWPRHENYYASDKRTGNYYAPLD